MGSPVVDGWNNSQMFKDQINTALAAVFDSLISYGTSLPAVTDQFDGSLFIVMPGKTWYQLRSGSWVAI